MANNRFLLIETGAAVNRCTDSPAAHANPILIGIVTPTDNHQAVFARAYTFKYGNEVT